jgi:hypothetical protein
MSNTLKEWHSNRPSSRRSILKRWLRNPVGAVIRVLEIVSLGVPLVSTLKVGHDFADLQHLNPEMHLSDNGTGYLLISTNFNLSIGTFSLDSGHVVSVRNSHQFFMSGQHLHEIRKTRKKAAVSFRNVIPLPKQHYYYHFLSEEIPEILKVVRNLRNYVVLTSDTQPEWVFNVLNYLQIDYRTTGKSVVSLIDGAVPVFAKPRSEWSNQLLRSSVGFPRLKISSKNILILRSGLDRSSTKLDKLLISLTAEYKYELIDPSSITFEEQVAVFQQASSIIALHGGSLTNLIFCQEQTKVLEIFNHAYRNFDFQRISEEQNLTYVPLDTEESIFENELSKYLKSIHD